LSADLLGTNFPGGGPRGSILGIVNGPAKADMILAKTVNDFGNAGATFRGFHSQFTPRRWPWA
jgi:hypothetical protein